MNYLISRRTLDYSRRGSVYKKSLNARLIKHFELPLDLCALSCWLLTLKYIWGWLLFRPLHPAVSSGSGLEGELFGMGMWSLGLGAVGAAIAGIFLANTDLCLPKAASASLDFLADTDLRSTTDGGWAFSLCHPPAILFIVPLAFVKENLHYPGRGISQWDLSSLLHDCVNCTYRE